ncbi:MAG: acyltransferase domain-containing protein [Bacillota bacterium]
MELHQLLQTTGLDDKYLEVLEPRWDKSCETFPGTLEFLLQRNYQRAAVVAGLPSAALQVLDEIAGLIRSDPELSLLIWHCYQSQYVYPDPWFEHWPWLQAQLGTNSTVFYLLVMLAALPLTEAKFRELGIPAHHAAALCSRIGGFYCTYYTGYGSHGINPYQLFWSRFYTDGKIFRVGRLEFWPQEFGTDKQAFAVFRNRNSGNVLALQARAYRYDAAGHCLGGFEDHIPAAFTGSYQQSAETVSGIPVRPEGSCLAAAVTLDLQEWQPVFSATDTLLDIHIPEGGKMTPESVRQSLTGALEFFSTYFPQLKIAGFVCMSWIFNPRYENLLPQANMSEFMRNVYLIPFPASKRDEGFYFLFGKDYLPGENYSRDTKLRRMMLDELQAGRPLRHGLMFCLAEDAEKFGEQCYRRCYRANEILDNRQAVAAD